LLTHATSVSCGTWSCPSEQNGVPTGASHPSTSACPAGSRPGAHLSPVLASPVSSSLEPGPVVESAPVDVVAVGPPDAEASPASALESPVVAASVVDPPSPPDAVGDDVSSLGHANRHATRSSDGSFEAFTRPRLPQVARLRSTFASACSK